MNRFEQLGGTAKDIFMRWWQRQKLLLSDPEPEVEQLYSEKPVGERFHSRERYLLPGEGIMNVTHFPGMRGVRLPVPIWHDRIGVICNGGMPLPSEQLPEHLARLKSQVARRFVKKNIEMICVTSDGVQIDIEEGKPDFVRLEIYEAIAACAFAEGPELSALMLRIDPRAPEYKYSGRFIPRSTLEPPPGPAPAI